MNNGEDGRPRELELALAHELETKVWGRAHRHFAQTTSTNDEAMRWIEQAAAHGALVTADRQTRGRGRLGRTWASPRSEDLYATAIVRARPGTQGIGALGLAVGLGLLEAMAQRWASWGTWQLKWPNDLLLDGRKLGGVLCEAKWSQGEVAVACGFGINVGRARFEDAALAQRATSLRIAAQAQGQEPPPGLRASVLCAALQGLETWVETYLSAGFSAIGPRYRARCRELGQELRLSGVGPDGGPPGTVYQAVDLDEDGALLVRRAGSSERLRVQSQDVWLARADPP